MQIAPVILALFLFAGNDNNVEWQGVSHIDWLDRRPRCPVDGEAFSVRVQAYANDLTGVRAHYDDGSGGQWVTGYYLQDRGPYAIWQVDLPATVNNNVNYYLELSDGSDVDFVSVSGVSETTPVDGGFALDFTTLEHAPLGATPVTGGGVAFRVWAPTATNCVVSGDWNLWAIGAPAGADPLTKYGDYFSGLAPAASSTDRYKYVFRPGPIVREDARARGFDPADQNRCRIIDPLAYAWQSGDFQMPEFGDLIVYQAHVGTFSGRNDGDVASGSIPGTYLDMAAHVDHLVELGINCLYLMPINEFPFDYSGGYNPISQFAPEWAYGDPDDLRYLVDVMHQNGIAVILDTVWNHFDGGGNILWNYDGGQIYFRTPDVQTPWGSQADFTRAEVRQYFLDSILVWFEEYRLDGQRMDATDYMNIFPQEAEGWSLMQEMNDLIDQRTVDKWSMAEQLPDDFFVTRPVSQGGAGFDSQLHDYFVDTLRQEIFDAALGDPEMWKIADIIDGSGTNMQKRRVVNYLESHDELWESNGGNRLVKVIDTTAPHDDEFAMGRTKLGYGVVFGGQGVPMIHQGTEWLESEAFGSGNPSGDNRINWNKKGRYKNIFRYYRDLIRVKKENGALDATADINVFHQNEGGNVIAWHRWDGAGNDLVVVANFSNTDYGVYNLGMPVGGTWYKLINSQDVRYDGAGDAADSYAANLGGNHGFAQSADISLKPMAFTILRANDPPVVPPCPTDFDGDLETGLNDLAILLANFGLSGASQADGDANGDGEVNLSDLADLLAAYGGLCP